MQFGFPYLDSHMQGYVFIGQLVRLVLLCGSHFLGLGLKKGQGGSMAEWLEHRTRNREVAGSNPILTTSWICSRLSQIKLLSYI